ncbi:MAG: V-type ATP synthase subunit I [Candidatus Odinarchaeota archaeon]
MKISKEMCLFLVKINPLYKDILLTTLAQLKIAHIKSKEEYISTQFTKEEEFYKERLKTLRTNLNLLFNKFNITENDFREIKTKKTEKIQYVTKDSHELINHLLEEIAYYMNRFIELDKYISDTKIELERMINIKNSYEFLERYNLTRENLQKLTNLEFKVYSTFSKNIDNLKVIFDFAEFPCIIHSQKISADRSTFFIIYPQDQELKLTEKIGLIHAEQVPILKKFLLSNGINFNRINNEIDLLENYILKYEKEIERIRDDNLLKFAAIHEVISNLEEYNWAETQFEELSLNRLGYKFFAPQTQKKEVYQKLIDVFNDEISIEIINIGRQGRLIKEQKLINPSEYKKSKIKNELNDDLKSEAEEPIEKWDSLKTKTPSLMAHNWLIRPFETLTKMYGTPSYSEIDPTPFLFITFPLLFGLMFGDIGHGLVLIISGIIGAIVFRKRGGNLYNFCWIIFWCGLWAILGGFLYGEFFGAHEILGYHLEPLPIPIPFVGTIILYDPLHNVITIFFITIFLGVIHINLGWIIQFINYCKISQKYKAFTESLMKILFLDGAFYLVLKYRFDFTAWLAPPFPPVLFPLIPGILLLLFKPIGKAIGISYLKKLSYGELLAEGSMDTFETVLSVPSNVLSYIRLLALALAHVSLMLAITELVSMISNQNLFEQIIIVISLIFGNIIVILIEGILVFLNALRLHFYEFFFKFYEGRGTNFVPFVLEENYSNISFKLEIEKDVISTEIEKEIETKETKEHVEKARDYISSKYL